MRAVVLLSGGQDSATCLYFAKEKYGDVHAVTINYGQRHASEIEAAKAIAELADVNHVILDIPAIKQIGDSALVSDATICADGGREDSECPKGLPTSFVPGRNTVLISLAAMYAAKIGASVVVTGVCQTDYSGYPDCRRVFIDSLEETLNLGLAHSIKVETPLMDLTKAETVKMARDLDCWPALALSVTCYHGKRPGCGECPSCQVRARGFAEAGEEDPGK